MSADLFVFLILHKPVNIDAWQKAIEKTEMPLVLDKSVNLETHSGFLPIKTHGKSSGFEFYYENDNTEFLEHFPSVSK